MRKFIEADKLIAEIEKIKSAVEKNNHIDEFGSTEQCMAAAEVEGLNLIIETIKELQRQQPSLPSNLDEAAEEYCSDNTPLGATCRACFRDGAEWMAGQGLNAKKEVQPRTCKTCGFYENNCPFIRGELIPYPNRVCKDYTYSATKEQAKLSTNENVECKCGKIDDKLFEKELENEKTKLFDAFGPMNGEQQSLAIRNFARHFYELGLNAKKEE